MKTLNYLDSHVKSAILFSQFTPSRIHVLEQIFLTNGNGMAWAKHPESGLYVAASCETINDGVWSGNEPSYLNEALHSETAPHLTDIEQVTSYHFMNTRTGKALDNVLHQWLFDNIDDVCQSSYYAGDFDLSPKTLPLQHSRQYSLLGTMPDVAAVCPITIKAIEELCDHLLKRFVAFDGEAASLSNDVLHRLRHNWPGYSELYLTVMHAKEAINTHTKKAERDAAFIKEMLGSDEEQFADSGLSDTLTFDAYLQFVAQHDRLPSRVKMHTNLKDYIKREQKCRLEFFPNDQPNEAFFVAAQPAFESLGYRYFDIGSLTSQLSRTLNLPEWHKHHAEAFIRDNLPMLVPAS